MNAKQIVGLLGSLIVIVGCFMPIATFPIVGDINYMFPPGGQVGDGVFVAGLAVLGMLGAVRGSSILLLLSSILGGLIVGYSVNSLSDVLSGAQQEDGLVGALMSTAGFGPGLAAISVGLMFMLVASAMPRAKRSTASTEIVKCPSCAEWIQKEAKRCRFCGEEITTTDDITSA